jgi:hypothetical protein
MEAVEHLEAQMNTPITKVGIHSSMPKWTIKTGSIERTPTTYILGAPEYGISKIPVANTYPVHTNISINEYLSTLSPSSIRASAQERKDRRYVEYISEFSKSWNSNRLHFNSFTKDFVWDKFKITIDKLLQIRPDYITFNLTNDCSIFFKAILKGLNIYLELFFDEDSEESTEVIVNIYQDGKVVMAYGGNIEETFQKIQGISTTKDKIVESTSIPYAISSVYFATTEF